MIALSVYINVKRIFFTVSAFSYRHDYDDVTTTFEILATFNTKGHDGDYNMYVIDIICQTETKSMFTHKLTLKQSRNLSPFGGENTITDILL